MNGTADNISMDLKTGIRGKYVTEVMEYVRGCIDGTIIAGEDRILACQRFTDFLGREDLDVRTHDADFVIGIGGGAIVAVVLLLLLGGKKG